MWNFHELVTRATEAELELALIDGEMEKRMRSAVLKWARSRRYRLKLKAKQAPLQRETAQALRQELLAAYGVRHDPPELLSL